MTTAAPLGSGSSVPTQGDGPPPSTPLSWEGDRMFNIYIYDYCYKRGFRKTAHELLMEADISPESTPPINARQGLLFEWWSVFWVLFTAKSNGVGTDDAMLYTQHQAQRQAQQRMNPQAAQMGRFVSGMQRPGLMSNGSMPNGVGSAALPGQGPIPTGGQGPVSFPMTGPGPQPNGITGTLPAAGGSSSGPSQSFGQLLPGQRPPPIGSQPRGPNGMPPFQSPTMSHSPQNPGGVPLHQHSQAPMGQLGPSPHLAHRGGMLPPNGLQGMNNQGSMGASQAHTPTPGFQQLGRPPSRAATPGHNPMMTHPSPSLAARQPPGGTAPDMRAQEIALNHELNRIPPQNFNAIKQEAGLGEKDLQSFTLEEKQRFLATARRGGSRNFKPGLPGATNAAAGPSGSNPSMQPPNQRNQHQHQQRGSKRNSTSPGEEHETLPRNEASPPDRKRIRRSPTSVDQQQQAPVTPMSYPHPPPQGGPGVPQQMSNNMMRGPMSGPPMNGFPHPPGIPHMGNNPGMGMQMGQGIGVPQMGNAMSPGMNHPGPGGMMAPQMQMQQLRDAQFRMQSLHKGGLASGVVLNNVLPGAGSPSTSDPSFNPGGPQGQGPQFSTGPNNRMGQSKPMVMMPPPSPSMNGPPKDQPGSKDNKGTNSNPSNSHPEGSPRNAPNSGQQGQGPSNPGNPSQGGTAPPTPVPGPNQSMTAPSPSAILGNPPSMNQSSQPSSDLFSSDFIQSVASSLDEFDPSMFRSDGDINFERDFGQWFNPDDVTSLDLK